jgi:hypothetical protein
VISLSQQLRQGVSIFNIFRRKSGRPGAKIVSEDVQGTADLQEPLRVVRDYISRLRAGGPQDEQFEASSLNQLGFTSLHLAELLFQTSNELRIPKERVTEFLSIGIAGGGDRRLANLIERIAILADSFDERERMLLLNSGAVGDRVEIGPIIPELDRVKIAVGFSRVVEALGELTDHKAAEATHGSVKLDPEWPTGN